MTFVLSKMSGFSIEEKVHEFESKGFLEISNEIFLQEEENHRLLTQAQLDYYNLEDDAYGECRARSYSRYIKYVDSPDYILDNSNDYFQSKEYNYDDGGKVRQFHSINDSFLYNPLIQNIVRFDTEFAFKTNIIDTSKDLIIGLHQVRYKATKERPSFSSPIWLHKDDEPVVFLHLMNLSNTAIGGDNLIANSPREINQFISLKEPLETLVFGQKVFHAVTPLGTECSTEAFRDILLVTLSYKETK
ncbi:2OG-Fe dioxygenase family protein [Bacillus cereus]|uniref:2OG-Fe dioxygenase family protein n=1 Tax=Bacillus cereus group TaxID=86661 RepID=UPI001157C438|nr:MULTISPECIES: 2OG-Fe dioxygenase family protein [Bacillus cereus group]UPJ17482.1 2OG-Fe dioxygenase family protein [Bacillus cereus]